MAENDAEYVPIADEEWTEETDDAEEPIETKKNRIVLALANRTLLAKFPLPDDLMSHKSEAFKVFQVIYNTKNIPIQNWFMCSVCHEVIYVNRSNGTAKLLRHKFFGQWKEQQSMLTTFQIDKDELAIIFAKIAEIGFSKGPVKSEFIRSILPQTPTHDEWQSFYQKLITNAQPGSCRNFRINLSRCDGVVPNRVVTAQNGPLVDGANGKPTVTNKKTVKKPGKRIHDDLTVDEKFEVSSSKFIRNKTTEPHQRRNAQNDSSQSDDVVSSSVAKEQNASMVNGANGQPTVINTKTMNKPEKRIQINRIENEKFEVSSPSGDISSPNQDEEDMPKKKKRKNYRLISEKPSRSLRSSDSKNV